MPGKILFCATVDYHFKAFHQPFMKWFQEQGWAVHVAASGNMALPYTDEKFDIPIQRSPFRWRNNEAYQQLKTLIGKNKYDIIHCHTPMGGMLARLAARKARKQGTAMIYTAHGFHFGKGAPLLNWLAYYPIERFLSSYTDVLITINEEDYKLAINHRFKAQRIEHVHGVGVNIDRFKPIDEIKKCEMRKSFGYAPDDFLLFYAAEFNKNKNQQLLVKVMALLKEKVPQVKLLLAGDGPLLGPCRELANTIGVSGSIDFLGYRKDIDELLPVCDIAVASSIREGLPVNIMEAMACALPVVASDNRGHRALIHNNETGWMTALEDATGMCDKINELARDRDLCKRIGASGRERIETMFSVTRVLKENSLIYSTFMQEKVTV